LTPGRFVTLEGIDGAGKSSHVQALAQVLGRRGGLPTLVTREPGGTPLAETLRGLVLHQAMDSLTELLLVFAARRDHLQQTIAPALAGGRDVLCDRFTDASFAYQGGGRGMDAAVLTQLESWVQQGRQPDLTIWFDLPAETAAQRLAAARAPDRFEQQDRAFFERVRSAYAMRAAQQPHRFVRIDAALPPEAVRAQALEALRRRWPESQAPSAEAT
jgi:dTMP kinase